MWIGWLGSLQVRVDGAAVTVPAARQRALLAVLAVRAGELVPTDELADTVWDGMPPARAADTIRNYVKRLRFRLGLAGRQIVTCWPGYRLEVAGDELDLRVFTRLCRDGGVAVRAGDWAAAFGGLGQALELWRGAPFADAGCERLAREQVPALSELRLQAAEWRAEAGLALGRHAELAGELAGWCAAEPLRERFASLRMLALYRSGRQADALATYQQARRMLVDELGVEPGEELRRLHQQILARDPALAVRAERDVVPAGGSDAVRVVPQQLPAAVARFAGRSGELRVLAGLAEQAASGAGGTVVISAIGGTAGVGKTALAVHFAHQVAGLFPDGQLYADLRGFSPSGDPVHPARVVRGFLDALGVAAQAVPADADAQAGLYRSVLAGRRMLVVLDNARDAAQVRPLLPGSAGCLVVVTSRSDLTGLAATGDARLLTLGLLPEQEARELLAGRLGAGRVEAEPDAVDELIRLCARLPLALAITAARAAARPAHPLAALAAELRTAGGPLDALDAGEPVASVRAVFSWSYQHLDSRVARGFRLAGLHPGPDFDRYAVAALTGMTAGQASLLLDTLARAYLIHAAGPGRYCMHDLLRSYARELAACHDGEAEEQAALTRLFDYYLHSAATAMDAVFPTASDCRSCLPAPTAYPPMAGPAAALAWLDAERACLTATVAYAAENGWPRHTTRLAATLSQHLESGGYFYEASIIHNHAIRSARNTGDHDAEANALNNLGRIDWQQGRSQQAVGHLQQALALFRQGGDLNGQAHAQLNLGTADGRQGNYEEAAGRLREALVLCRETDDQVGQARALNNLAIIDLLQGRYRQATVHLQRALALEREAGDKHGEHLTLNNLGIADLKRGHHRRARGHLELALALCLETGDRPVQAHVLATLGELDLRQHCYEQALDSCQRSLALCSEIGDRYSQARAHNGLGETLLAVSGPAEAQEQYAAALVLAAQIGDKYDQARAHNGLARSYQAAGDSRQARSHWQQALVLYIGLGAPEADQVRAQLTGADAR